MQSENTTGNLRGPVSSASDADRLALSRALLEMMPEGVFFADSTLNVKYANPAFTRMILGTDNGILSSLNEIYDHKDNTQAINNARVALEAVGFWQGDLLRTKDDGAVCTDRLMVSAARDTSAFKPEGKPESPKYVAYVQDISEKKLAEEKLLWARNHDELTGLPNRNLFCNNIDTKIQELRDKNRILLIVCADLDDFKRYNLDYSHELGDCLLKACAMRLKGKLRPCDFLGRTAGDEFSLMVPLDSMDQVHKAAEDIRDSFIEPLSLDGKYFPIKASLGLAVWPIDGDDSISLMAAADLALQECKNQGKDGIMCFDESLHISRKGKTQLENDLRYAISAELLYVNYQPVVRVSDGIIEGVEALARWLHPQRGLINPDSFIPIAEKTGLIVDLGALVLRSACIQGDSWASANKGNLSIAVNVSPVQLKHPGFPEYISNTLNWAGLPPDKLVIEITESVLFEHLENAAQVLGSLKDLGVKISVDDFGTGYSSFSYLKNLPVDNLKIDREFIKGMEASDTAREVVSGIIDLSHRMNLTVIAEGVETAEQYYILRDMNCDFVQGFLFGKPAPAVELEDRYFIRTGASRFSTFFLR